MASRRRARGSIYKQRRNGVLEDVWTIAYRVNGRRFRERAFTDKAASEQLLSQRLRDAARDAVGIGDPYRKHRGRPLREHLEEFLAGIASRNRTSKHRKLMRARLLRAFDAMKAFAIADLELGKAEQWLAELLDDGVAVKTRDHYALALRQFGVWLLDSDRVARNPFHRLHGVGGTADVRRERLSLTAEQVQLLAAAAEQRPVQVYREGHPQAYPETLARYALQGRHRGLLYLFSALTGLRSSECKGIRWADIELGDKDGADAWVTPRPATTKAKRRDPLPLDPRLASLLTAWREDLGRREGRVPAPTAAVFHVPKNLPELLRKDAAWAEIPVVDDEGRRLDFHSLRATYATLLARAGVPMQIARRMIRHVDPKLTARHYEKLAREDLRAGSQLLATMFWTGSVGAQMGPCGSPEAAQHDTSRRDDGDERRRASS